MKSGFPANAGSSPKKSANKKTTSQKSNPRAKSHHGAAERSSSAVEQPLQPAGKQVAQRMRVHHQKNPQTKNLTSQKSHPRDKSPPRSRGCTAFSADHSRSNQQENKSRNECGFITKKIREQKKQPHKNPIHATNLRHGAADAPHPRRSNSRSNQQENKSRNECGFITPKNPQTKKPNLPKIQSTRQISTTEPRMHRILGGPQPLQPAGKQVAQRMRLPLHSPKQGNLLESSP